MRRQRVWVQTIDLDKIGFAEATRIAHKIARQWCAREVKMQASSQKGYHISIVCWKECDLCRFLFDDPHRYIADLTNRTPTERNVLWNDKRPIARVHAPPDDYEVGML